MFSYKRQFTFYLYTSVNRKSYLSFKILRTVNFYAIFKICNLEKNLTDFENRLKSEVRELVFLLLFTCSFVVSVSWRLKSSTWDGLRFFNVALPGPSVNYLIQM